MRHTLKEARKKAGHTQKKIATVIGISERYYQKIEAGNNEGKGYIWDALETLLDTPQRQLRENS